jgi:CheY-like chemotaxis protein
MTDEQPSPRVLVVDDDPSILRVVRRILEAGGYETRGAANGVEALAIDADEGPFDLLLTDFVMPEMRGNEFARLLHQRRPATKVLYLTGHLAELFTLRASLHEDETVLEKPATAKALLEGVSMSLFGHPRGMPRPGVTRP